MTFFEVWAFILNPIFMVGGAAGFAYLFANHQDRQYEKRKREAFERHFGK